MRNKFFTFNYEICESGVKIELFNEELRMNDWLPVIIMVNNYFHDVATALLAASALTMLFILRAVSKEKLSLSQLDLVQKIYQPTTRLAVFSLVWVLIGGIPRTVFFKRFEWWDAAGKGIIPALIVKHFLMFCLVLAGFALWAQVKKKIENLPKNKI